MAKFPVVKIIPSKDLGNELTGSSCSNSDPFALQVLGDSMEPEFPDRCIVIIDPAGVIEDGAYVFAKYNDEWIFRRLRIENGQHRLIAENSDYEIHDIPGIEAIYGRIVQRSGNRRKLNKRYD